MRPNDINWDNRDYVLAAVKRDGMVLQLASKRLQEDREVVMAAVQKDAFALQIVREWFGNDLEIVKAAVKTGGMALQFASPKLRADQGVVMSAVQQWGSALLFASEKLKNDLKIVKEAVHQYPVALEFASEKLKNDPERVKAVVMEYPVALRYVSEELKANRNFILEVVNENPFAIIYQTAIGFETEEDLLAHLQALKIQAEILATLQKKSELYRVLHEAHVEHFKQLLSRDNTSRLNDILLDYFQKNRFAMLTNSGLTKEKRKAFNRVSRSGFIEKLEGLQDVKNQLSDLLSPQQEAKWNEFISFLKEKGFVKDDESQNLVFTTNNTPSQSESSRQPTIREIPKWPRGALSQLRESVTSVGISPLSIEGQAGQANEGGRQPLLTGNSGVPGTEPRNPNCLERCTARCVTM